jgi:hypothetical protein
MWKGFSFYGVLGGCMGALKFSCGDGISYVMGLIENFGKEEQGLLG